MMLFDDRLNHFYNLLECTLPLALGRLCQIELELVLQLEVPWHPHHHFYFGLKLTCKNWGKKLFYSKSLIDLDK